MTNITPRQLLIRLLSCYAVIVACVSVSLLSNADVLHFLPSGGIDALEGASLHMAHDSTSVVRESGEPAKAEGSGSPSAGPGNPAV